jgi:catechol 2,3-dioxygenase-like lactoylglutathione lyase family enzyme
MASRIDHIGVLVTDLDAAVAFMEDTFGLDVTTTIELPEGAGRSQFLPWGEVSIELVELTDREVSRERLGDSPARVDHVAVAVDDLDAELERLGEGDAVLSTGAPTELGGRRFAFLDPSTTKGVKLQLIEADG